MTTPPDLPFGADATDPIDEQASALLDAGRSPDERGLDPVVTSRLREMEAARSLLRDVPAPDADRREAAIAAALTAFGATGPDATSPDAAVPELPVTAIDRAWAASRPGRRASPQWLLGAAAAIAVLGLGAYVVGHTGSSSTSGSAAVSFGKAASTGAATTAAAAAGSVAADQALAPAAGAAEATIAAAATTAAAGTGATPAALVPSTATNAPADLPSLGEVKDLPSLRRKLTVFVSAQPLAPGASTTAAGPTTTAARSRTTSGAITVTNGADCSDRGTVIATLTWQDTAAYLVLDARGPVVLDATDCHELVRP